MSEKNNNRWMLGLIAGMLTTIVGGSMWTGALANRVSTLEASEQVRQIDHDIIVRLDTQQQQMLKELEQINRKLDKLNGDE